MSARPFWILFSICIVILVQWLVVKPMMEWRLTDEIVEEKIEYKFAFPEVEDVKDDRIVVKEDVQDKHFKEKWDILYDFAPNKAIAVAATTIIMGLMAAFLIASVAFRHLVKFGDRLGELTTTDKIAIFFGLLIGVMLSTLLLPGIMQIANLPRHPLAISLSGIVIIYLCVMAVMSMKEELRFYFPSASKDSGFKANLQKTKILDTNVIIDGRIADICRTNFLEGQICIPSFVLEELQHIADSSDSLRRARGRRGLDILNQMRKEFHDLIVKQDDPIDPDNAEEVDARLVKLAQQIDGCIVTNDFNLNKVAELQGVTVLNINELANSLKPVVLPGEEMTVSIVKEGKETGQGVAYLDDGTMVVVEGGKAHIGKNADAVVTSVLQTVAGKMIFANLKAVQEEEDELIGRNVRSYSGFRPRKKTK